jgi:hypothetical protein
VAVRSCRRQRAEVEDNRTTKVPAGKLTYWNVHDVEDETPAKALAEIDRHVEKLIISLGH